MIWKFINSLTLHKLQDLYAAIYINVDIKIKEHLLNLCWGGCSNKLVMITWSASSHQTFDIKHFDCVWTPSFFSSLSSCGSVLCRLRTRSNHWVQQLHPRNCGGDRSLWAKQSLILCCFASQESHLVQFLFPATCHQPGAASNRSELARLSYWLSSSPGWSSWSGWMRRKTQRDMKVLSS